MRIVVTGALGHVGSRLIRGLSSNVTEIDLIDNLATSRYASLFNLPETPNYRFIESDIRQASVEKYIKGADVVIHLAAFTDAGKSVEMEAEVKSVNVDGLSQVAHACLKHGVPMFFPSTTSVYSSGDGLVDETSKEIEGNNPYTQSKITGEKLLSELGGQGLRFVICRWGTIFGWSVGMRFHTAVNKFTWQAVNGQPLSVWKTAWEQRRAYLDLGDAVSVINFLIENDLFDGEIYNVLTGNYTVEDIVTTIKEFIPATQVEMVDSAIMNDLSFDVADEKIRAQGYMPKGDLRQSIGDTVAQLDGITEKEKLTV